MGGRLAQHSQRPRSCTVESWDPRPAVPHTPQASRHLREHMQLVSQPGSALRSLAGQIQAGTPAACAPANGETPGVYVALPAGDPSSPPYNCEAFVNAGQVSHPRLTFSIEQNILCGTCRNTTHWYLHVHQEAALANGSELPLWAQPLHFVVQGPVQRCQRHFLARPAHVDPTHQTQIRPVLGE